MLSVPEVVKKKAALAGADRWVADLPDLVANLGDRWGFAPVRSFDHSTEAWVLEVQRVDGSAAVLKLVIPRDFEPARREITVLTLADGQGCPRLLASDPDASAILMERLGRPMFALSIPLRRRHELLCATAARLWRTAADSGLPTGAEKGRWLSEFVTETWEALDRPVPEATVDHALGCVQRRIDAHDDERAVLVHGDVHQWNAVEAEIGFKLVDPDGLLAEPEYDLGIIMREDPIELIAEGPWNRAHRLATMTGCDATAIWEWGVVERLSTGLLLTQIGLEPVARQMLAAADAVAQP